MLTVDIGNTHIKWALWEGGLITRRGSCSYLKQEPEPAFAVWQDLRPQRRVFVANVAGDAVGRALRAWIMAHWSARVEFLRSTSELFGVTNAYADPAQYGVDRWAALLGAHSRYKAPVCIIDAGTAVTVDLLDAGGLHRGGRILPGLSMMREALLGGTAGIQRIDGNPVLFADNTADAVSSGTLHMLRAALLEIIGSARQCLGNGMKIIITGGMSEQIMSLPDLPDMVHEPDLVLIGLHAVAEKRFEGD
jgi:type III pantothenate kinase